ALGLVRVVIHRASPDVASFLQVGDESCLLVRKLSKRHDRRHRPLTSPSNQRFPPSPGHSKHHGAPSVKENTHPSGRLPIPEPLPPAPRQVWAILNRGTTYGNGALGMASHSPKRRPVTLLGKSNRRNRSPVAGRTACCPTPAGLPGR